VVGHGRAEKRQVAYVVRHALKLAAEPPADAADALALALCHVRSVFLDAYDGRVLGFQRRGQATQCVAAVESVG